jgi:hypothetical protein
MIQGIYCIENSRSGRKYFGSSKNVIGRLHELKREISQNVEYFLILQLNK